MIRLSLRLFIALMVLSLLLFSVAVCGGFCSLAVFAYTNNDIAREILNLFTVILFVTTELLLWGFLAFTILDRMGAVKKYYPEFYQ